MHAVRSSPPPSRLPRRRGRRLLVVAVAVAAALVGTGVPAWAHVTAQPGTAIQGGYTAVSFRTPNERDAASTVRLEVTLPAEHPIASVATRPLPGWTAATQTTTLATPISTADGDLTRAVSKITWSGGRIDPGQFQEFTISLGPLPTDTDRLVFKAVQTYDDGEVVRWIEEPTPGGPEPEHPAPTLTLLPATAGTAAGPTGSGDRPALALGIAGTVLGLVGTALGARAVRRDAGRGRHG